VSQFTHAQEKFFEPPYVYDEGRSSGPRQYPLNLYQRPSTYSLKRAVPALRFSIRKPRFPQAGLSLL
jgi:hypothetical protein